MGKVVQLVTIQCLISMSSLRFVVVSELLLLLVLLLYTAVVVARRLVFVTTRIFDFVDGVVGKKRKLTTQLYC